MLPNLMKVGSGSQVSISQSSEGGNSSVKHHGFIQMCYFELNVISGLLWNELPFTHNTCEKATWFPGKVKKKQKMANNDEEQQRMGWVEAGLKRGVARSWRWSMCGTKRKGKRKGCCHLTSLSVNQTRKSTKGCCTSVSQWCLHRT